MGGFQKLGQTVPVQSRIERAVAQLKSKGVENDHCPRCNVFDWSVDILDIPVNSAMSAVPLYFLAKVENPLHPILSPQPTGTFSVLSLVCKNCGYSIFHSLSILDK
jgi:hypothetical protein